MIYLLLGCIFVLGLVIGSFFNVLIYRLPRNEEFVVTPSHCMSCNHKLKSYDLVPLFSYLFLGGKCRYCKKKISMQYPLVEFFTGISFTLITYFMLKAVNFIPTAQMGFDLLTYLVLVGICIPVFVIDLKYYIIPNGLMIFGIIAGLIIKIVQSIYMSNWFILLDGLAGLLIAGVIFMLIILIGKRIAKAEVMGVGDLKLMSVIGLFIGFKLTLVAILFSYIIGCIVSIILLASKKKTRKDIIPFGPFIILGLLTTIIYGHAFLDWYFNGITV